MRNHHPSIPSLLVIALLLALPSALSQQCDDASSCNGNWENFDYANGNIAQVPADKIDVDKAIAAGKGKDLNYLQVSQNLEKIQNLKDVDENTARLAIESKYSISLQGISQGARIQGGVLEATGGAKDRLDLTSKNGWLIEIDALGRIRTFTQQILQKDLSPGDQFFIADEAELETSSGPARVKGLSYVDGRYLIDKGATASINGKTVTVQEETQVSFGNFGLERLLEQKTPKDLGILTKQIVSEAGSKSPNTILVQERMILLDGKGISFTDPRSTALITVKNGNLLFIDDVTSTIKPLSGSLTVKGNQFPAVLTYDNGRLDGPVSKMLKGKACAEEAECARMNWILPNGYYLAMENGKLSKYQGDYPLSAEFHKNQFGGRLDQRIEKGIERVQARAEESGQTISLTLEEVKSLFMTESGLNPSTRCVGGSCGIPQITKIAVDEVNSRYGTSYKWSDIQNQVLAPEVVAEVGVLYYGLMKEDIKKTCTGCDEQTVAALTQTAYNLGPQATKAILLRQGGSAPTTEVFMSSLTPQALKEASPSYYGKWSDERLARKVEITKQYYRKVNSFQTAMQNNKKSTSLIT